MARASCDAPDFVFEKDGKAEFIRKIKPQVLKLHKALLPLNLMVLKKLLFRVGIGRTIPWCLISIPVLLKQNNLSLTIPSQLLASVHEVDNGLWWTSYREENL